MAQAISSPDGRDLMEVRPGPADADGCDSRPGDRSSAAGGGPVGLLSWRRQPPAPFAFEPVCIRWIPQALVRSHAMSHEFKVVLDGIDLDEDQVSQVNRAVQQAVMHSLPFSA